MERKALELRTDIFFNERNLIIGVVIGLVTSFITNMYVALFMLNFKNFMESIWAFLLLSALLIVILFLIYRWFNLFKNEGIKLMSEWHKIENEEPLDDKEKSISNVKK